MALTAHNPAYDESPKTLDDIVQELTDDYGIYMTLEQVADVLYLSSNTVQKRIGAERHQHLPWVRGVKSARVWERSNRAFHTRLIAPLLEHA